MSRRAKRMARHHRRLSRRYSFNLVSLMDIFTILVFFLLVNSAEVQTLPNPKELALPESKAEQKARETTVVMLTRNEILVHGEAILTIEDALDSDSATLPELAEAMKRRADRRIAEMAARGEAGDASTAESDGERTSRGEVTIMADRDLPFSLIKKVMLTCTNAKFDQISLATMRETGENQT